MKRLKNDREAGSSRGGGKFWSGVEVFFWSTKWRIGLVTVILPLLLVQLFFAAKSLDQSMPYYHATPTQIPTHTHKIVATKQHEQRLFQLAKNYQNCMLDLERIMYPLIWEWREARKPIPVSVKIIDDRFYVLLNTEHIYLFNGIFRKATIYCNDIPGAKVMGHKRKGIVESMVVECPVDLNPARTKFEKLTILSNANGASNESLIQNNDTYIYPENMLRKMDECERLDMLQESERNVKTAATAAFRGGIKKGQTAQFSSWKSVRRQALEWAEYHHLIGIDHMWIYVNEAWDNGVDLPYRDYITWIPFDLNVYNYDVFTNFL